MLVPAACLPYTLALTSPKSVRRSLAMLRPKGGQHQAARHHPDSACWCGQGLVIFFLHMSGSWVNRDPWPRVRLRRRLGVHRRATECPAKDITSITYQHRAILGVCQSA